MNSQRDTFGTSGRVFHDAVGVAFRLNEGTVAVHTPTQKIAEHVARFFPHYALPLESVKPDETYWLNDDCGTWSVGIRGTPVVDGLNSLRDALNGLEQLIVTRLLALTPNCAQIHATGTVQYGNAILVLGASGAGKTSIALRWATNGQPVLGDDVVLLNNGGIAAPFKRMFVVRSELFHIFDIAPDPSLAWLSDEKDAWYDPSSDACWADPAPVGAIALVQYEADVGLHVEELPKPQALSALLASLMPSGAGSAEFFDRAIAMVGSARTIELRFSDSAEAAEFLVSRW